MLSVLWQGKIFMYDFIFGTYGNDMLFVKLFHFSFAWQAVKGTKNSHAAKENPLDITGLSDVFFV